MKWSRKKL